MQCTVAWLYSSHSADRGLGLKEFLSHAFLLMRVVSMTLIRRNVDGVLLGPWHAYIQWSTSPGIEPATFRVLGVHFTGSPKKHSWYMWPHTTYVPNYDRNFGITLMLTVTLPCTTPCHIYWNWNWNWNCLQHVPANWTDCCLSGHSTSPFRTFSKLGPGLFDQVHLSTHQATLCVDVLRELKKL
jgi:hypothetical protein